MAARPQTLLVSLSSIFVGAALARLQGQFNVALFSLALITAILLQILSNFANDYGDAVSGADNHQRVGPTRVMASGMLTKQSMLKAISLLSALAALSGLALLYVAFAGHWLVFASFVLLGLLSILAAITYTMGRLPYGYLGFGDLSVFLFFGILAVLGTQYLFTLSIPTLYWLPAISCGALATAVLNVNNIRDLHTDKETGKNTIVVRIGHRWACYYHLVLLLIALIGSGSFLTFYAPGYTPLLLLLPWLLLLRAAWVLATCQQSERLNQQLKITALGGFIFNLIFLLILTLH